MNLKMSLGSWEQQKVAARALRYEVFVVEQKVPVELEWDDMDAECLHAVVQDDRGEPLGTGRLLPDGHIGRMAVRISARGSGAGGLILTSLMEEARRRGDHSVMLHAQLHAASFYERHGFQREGNVFEEAGIPHVFMRHTFSRT